MHDPYSDDLAQAVILDAEVTTYTPQKLWISSGIRAVDHAVEALYPPNSTPKFPIVQNALIALPLLFKYLLQSHAKPDDIEARQKLLLAAYHSLFPNPSAGALGISHAMGHGLGASFSIPHGITSCLTLAGACALVSAHAGPGDAARLSQGLNAVKSAGPLGLEPTQRFASYGTGDGVVLAGYIDALIEKLGLRTRLEDWKVPKESFGKMASALAARGFASGKENRPSEADALALLHEL